MKVSVIIPVYKAENFIRKSVESALFHDEVKEIILIEDGSPDNSLQECKALTAEYNRVHMYQHEGGVNKGAGASRNLGILKASQAFICFLDADDYMTAIRFEKEKEIFANNPDADGVYGAIGTHYYDEIGAKAWENQGLDEKHIDAVHNEISPEHLFENLIGFNRPYNGEVTIQTITIKRIKLFQYKIQFDETLRLHQDTLFLWQCAYYLKLFTGEIKKPLAIRGVHKDNRFIHHNNLSDSRSKFYRRSIIWAKEAKLKKEYIIELKNKYYNLSLKDFGIEKRIFRNCQAFILNSYFRRQFIEKMIVNLLIKPLRILLYKSNSKIIML